MTTMADDLERHNEDVVRFWQTFNSMIHHVQVMEDTMEELAGMWRGEAYNDLREHFDNDLRTFFKVRDSLNETYKAFDYTFDRYTECEQNVGRLISQISV